MTQTPDCKPWCENHGVDGSCSAYKCLHFEPELGKPDDSEAGQLIAQFRAMGKITRDLDRIADGVFLKANYVDENEEEQDGNLSFTLELCDDEDREDEDGRLGSAYLTLNEIKGLHAQMGAFISKIEASK
ncbi:hypothetical protein IWX65_002684 [Arthrobacter sp. CAN_A214]|uniref:hypothetical protein n=1 Tax=Arthrobacter sp. CAN_A214 TaxID=2787720 RepID=UPI0018CBEBD1